MDLEETQPTQIPIAEEEFQEIEEEEQVEEANEEGETGDQQTGKKNSQNEPKLKPKTVIREQGKTVLPIARVQRIMKADKVRE
jgi:hypothetical protein